jgi:hypothetical protein
MLRKQEMKQAKKDGAASVKKESQKHGPEQELDDSRADKERQQKSKTKRSRCNAVIYFF